MKAFMDSLVIAKVVGRQWPSPKIARALRIVAGRLPAGVRDELTRRRIVVMPLEAAVNLWPGCAVEGWPAAAGRRRLPESEAELRAHLGEWAWALSIHTNCEILPARKLQHILAHELAHIYLEHGHRLPTVTTRQHGGAWEVTMRPQDREAEAEALAEAWGFGRG